jgi:peptide/nickel transport system substrate-binding protein
VKNPDYWKKGKPYLDSVTFRVVSDSNTRALQVQGGQAQINEFPAYSSIAGLKKSKTVQVGLFPSSRTDYLTMNNTRGPLADVHARRAVSYAIDRASLIKAALYGNGTEANAFLTPSLWGHNETMKGISFDLEKAKSEIAQSGTPQGFKTTLTISSGDPVSSAEAQIIQKSLSAIGVEVELKQLDPSAVTAAKKALNYDMSFSYCTTDIIDPDEIIRFVADAEGGSNSLYSGYKSPEVTKLIEQASQSTEQDARKKLYDQVQVKVDEDTPLIPLYYSPSAYSFSSKVHGFTTLPTGNYTLADTWLSK